MLHIRKLRTTLRAVRFACLLAVLLMVAVSVPVDPGPTALWQKALAGGMACFLTLLLSLFWR